MKITKEYLKKLYNECNSLYFDNKLCKCDFSFFSKNVSYLGWYNGRETKNGKKIDKIWFGTSVIWNEDLLRKVLIHEMIHMYNRRIDKCKFNGLFGHGKYFKKHSKRIKELYGIDVLNFGKIEFINKKFSPNLLERIILWLFDR